MHRQVKIVAILLIVEGSLEALMGLFLAAMGPVMMSIFRAAPPPAPGSPDNPPPELFGAIYVTMGLVTLVGAILKIVAGIRNVKYRSRTLGFVALGSSLLSFASCYCTPTALALAIYGIIVYVNERSARAFQLGDGGMPPNEIIASIEGYAPYPGYVPPQYPPYPPPPM